MTVIPQISSQLRVVVAQLIMRLIGVLTLTRPIDTVRTNDFTRSRRLLDWLGNQVAPKNIAIEDVSIAGLKSRWFTPSNIKDDTVFLYCHGGGYCVGSVESHKGLCASIAKTAERRVLLFEYRLAPEHAYPAQIDDGMKVYREILRTIPASNIVLIGDSAGGGLVLALAQRIRDEGIAAPLGVVAICPWYDYEVAIASKSDIEDPGLPVSLVKCLARNVFQNETGKQYSLTYTRFDGMPPIYLQYAGADTLYAENHVLAHRLQTENSTGLIELWEGMPHVFAASPFYKESPIAIQHISEFTDSLA